MFLLLIISRSRSRDRKKRLMDLAHNGSSSSSSKPRQDFKRGPAFDDRVSRELIIGILLL